MYAYIHTATQSSSILPFSRGFHLANPTLSRLQIQPATLKVRDKENTYKCSICTHFIMFQHKYVLNCYF